SVLGNGARSGSDPSRDRYPSTCFSGMAPKAKLIFQAQGDTPDEEWPALNEILDQARTAGANLHTNSWGGSLGSSYSSQANMVDAYIWDHRDFLVLFSAGNSGVDKDADGIVDLYSLDEPGTSKNCLTVGASEGNRPDGCGLDAAWGQGWPKAFSAAPISSDHVSDKPAGIAAFSSRGPVLDGRHKPDLVAPGTNILSTRSSAAEKPGWGVYDDYYLWEGGTSMSTPITAGTAALVREYLTKVIKIARPSAALMKAALLNGARDISPGQYGTGNTREIPGSPVPNNVEGWGRLDLENTVYPRSPSTILYYDEKKALQTGESTDHHMTVVNASLPLKITLAWSDYPGSEISQGGLVNDLDLQVISPSSMIHYADHAVKHPTLTLLKYTQKDEPESASSDTMAIRFTPPAYPANLESVVFGYLNPKDEFSDVAIAVYDDKGPNGLPGRVLFKKVLKYIPPGEGGGENPAIITMGIQGVVINQGDFYVAIEKNAPDQAVVTEKGNADQRSYRKNGARWEVSADTAFIFAGVRGIALSTDFDRVNNVLGVTLPKPEPGAYTLRITGYNVPKGPQTYALVARGNISMTSSRTGAIQFESAVYDTSEYAGSVTIRVVRTNGVA
ncbi:MAG TPA: peptidase S8/S53 subtilisin kexin sedolisin, partial [Desulfobacteraceae bacterium]|nr:peptidase S8/S53 subtilisin kexin sedolisin [Desulfobacteraceae bacterium]